MNQMHFNDSNTWLFSDDEIKHYKTDDIMCIHKSSLQDIIFIQLDVLPNHTPPLNLTLLFQLIIWFFKWFVASIR